VKPPAERKLVTDLVREPTPEEIALVTDIDPEEVESIKRSAQAPVSLEKAIRPACAPVSRAAGLSGDFAATNAGCCLRVTP
jgi:DNA-directed RNA polymerase sigma subunit (sigma70/sigma32)